MIPKVSVLMSVYNGEAFLLESIRSILAQTFSDFELIIIDDGSTDRTWLLLQQFGDPRIRLLKHEKNLGLTHSLNNGLARAGGKYVARQDADDVSLQNRLDRQVDILEKNSNVVLVGTSTEWIDLKGMPLKRSIRKSSPLFNRWRLHFGNYISHSSAMYRKEAALSAGMYNEALRYSQDYDLWARMSVWGEVTQLSDVLVKWRKHESAISSQKNEQQRRIGAQVIQFMARHHLGIDRPLSDFIALRNLTAVPMDSKESVRIASNLAVQIWGAFRKKWRLGPSDFKLIREDMVRRMIKAASVQKEKTASSSRNLLVKAARIDPNLWFRKSYWRIFSDIVHRSVWETLR